MAKCDYPDCDEVLNYLPFNCKYCGQTFCKKHRLPENHKCSFKLEATSNSTDQNETYFASSSNYSQNTEIPHERSEKEIDKEMQDFMKRQERLNRQRNRQTVRIQRGNNIFSNYFGKNVSSYLILANVGFFILSFLLILFGVDIYKIFYLNVNYLFDAFMIQTIFTAMFQTQLSFWGFISLLFLGFILFGSGKAIETQYGSKVLLKLYFGSALWGTLAVLTMQIMIRYGILPFYQIYAASTQTAALYGVMAFLIYSIGLEREMRFIFFFIPIRLKAKYIIYILFGISLLYGFLGSAESMGAIAGLLFGIYSYRQYHPNNPAAAPYQYY